MALAGKVCLVTGASRGIGKGIALQVGGAGATVYITGRSLKDLNVTADEIKSRGGQPISVQLDHTNDKAVQDLFDRIKDENAGQLDLLVNNAYAGVGTINDNAGKPFWETKTPETWDCINNVGLRNHYNCSVYAARIMTLNRSGLIINISSAGGLRYIFNVPYGVGKAAVDRMATDCAHELKKYNVAMVSLWPGPVKTEEITNRIIDNPEAHETMKTMFQNGESVEFSGMAVVKLSSDPKIMNKTGKILLTSYLAKEYGFRDLDGTITGNMFSIKNVLNHVGYGWLANFVPSSLNIPTSLLHYTSNKF